MEEEKPLIKSKSFWGLLMTFVMGQDLVPVLDAIKNVVKGVLPQEWHVVVDIVGQLLIAVFTALGVLGVVKRKSTIRGMF